MKHSPKNTRSKKGFTIIELLIAITIFSLVSAGVITFYFHVSMTMFMSDQKLRINRDIRSITNEMTDFARDANYFVLYPSFYPVAGSEPPGDFRSPPDGYDGPDYRLQDGQSGDFILLVYEGFDPNPYDNKINVVKLVGYYRSIEDEEANTGPVLKFEVDIPESQQNIEEIKLESLIPTAGDQDNFSEVIELSKGLADGKLFYNFRDRSIMVNGQIYHGNAAKRVTDTYNFTISPRG